MFLYTVGSGHFATSVFHSKPCKLPDHSAPHISTTSIPLKIHDTLKAIYKRAQIFRQPPPPQSLLLLTRNFPPLLAAQLIPVCLYDYRLIHSFLPFRHTTLRL